MGLWMSPVTGPPATPRLCEVIISSKEEVITMDTPTQKRNFKLCGESHPNARLTRAQVVEIRKEAKVEGTSRAWLARCYGVSRSCIDRIVLGESWREAL